MFENLLYQGAAGLLGDDIARGRLPGAVLLAGPDSSGKLTCALEIARVLSCTAERRGQWLCGCPSCRRHRELAATNVLLAGPRDCSPEILAARRAFLAAAETGAAHLAAARSLFVRAVRKLTMRFSPVLWEDDEKAAKIAPVMQAADEQLEQIDGDKPLPSPERLEKICAELVRQAEKLESSFMYDALPIGQIRRASAWARLKSPGGKKVFVIERADRMNEAVRNALLKILEEPPEDAVFVLTAVRRGAVMPTILSRVRTYPFAQRTEAQQAEVIARVFHADAGAGGGTIDGYLQTFLPVTPEAVRDCARAFCASVEQGAFPAAGDIVKVCAGFEPRLLFRLFLRGVLEAQRADALDARGSECAAKYAAALRGCHAAVGSYNQTPAAALESLWRELFAVCRAERR